MSEEAVLNLKEYCLKHNIIIDSKKEKCLCLAFKHLTDEFMPQFKENLRVFKLLEDMGMLYNFFNGLHVTENLWANIFEQSKQFEKLYPFI